MRCAYVVIPAADGDEIDEEGESLYDDIETEEPFIALLLRANCACDGCSVGDTGAEPNDLLLLLPAPGAPRNCTCCNALITEETPLDACCVTTPPATPPLPRGLSAFAFGTYDEDESCD